MASSSNAQLDAQVMMLRRLLETAIPEVVPSVFEGVLEGVDGSDEMFKELSGPLTSGLTESLTPRVLTAYAEQMRFAYSMCPPTTTTAMPSASSSSGSSGTSSGSRKINWYHMFPSSKKALELLSKDEALHATPVNWSQVKVKNSGKVWSALSRVSGEWNTPQHQSRYGTLPLALEYLCSLDTDGGANIGIGSTFTSVIKQLAPAVIPQLDAFYHANADTLKKNPNKKS